MLGPIVGTNLLAVENGLNHKVFWCLFFVFLADATRENRWLAALMVEFGNDSKDMLLDIEMIHREILWQVAFIQDSKTVICQTQAVLNISSSYGRRVALSCNGTLLSDLYVLTLLLGYNQSVDLGFPIIMHKGWHG